MSEFKISRLRYTWKGEWSSTFDYIKDDVVQYGGSSWVCVRKHTSSAFETDQTYFANLNDTDPSPAWIKMVDGHAWKGDWGFGTLYEPGDLTLYGGVIYICNSSHTAASSFATNNSKWDVYVSLDHWTGLWVQNQTYGIGDLVKYNGVVYRCNTEHTSSSVLNGLEVDQLKWTVVHEGIEYVGVWAAATRYRPNDLVKYGGTILRCIVGHTSVESIDSEKFQTEFFGFNSYQEWIASSYYSLGDTVRHGGYLYKAIKDNFNSSPANLYDQLGSTDWSLLSKGVRYRGAWSAASQYKTGDLVSRGGRLYVATRDSDSDGSSLDYLEPGNWEIVIEGDNWRGFWDRDSAYYAVGDIVTYEGAVYRCNTDHIANDLNYPGDNGEGYYYWDVILAALVDAGLKQKGDLLTYNLERWEAGDGSTYGLTNVPIGQSDQLVSINNDETVSYRTWGNTDLFVYVSDDIGVDDTTDPDRGYNYFKPWRTIRYACEQIDAAGINLNRGVTIKVYSGTYEEVLPIIVPANVAIVGDETRAVTVKPKPSNPNLSTDASYNKDVLARLSAVASNLILGVAPIPSTSNTTQFVMQSDVGNPASAAHVQLLFQTAIAYINYRIVGSAPEAPVVTGSNIANPSEAYAITVDILRNNKDFLAAEAVAFMKDNNPSYTFDSTSCARDVKRYIDAIIYDIIYTGNYKTILAARYYANAVLGSEGEDMFYVRNATGLRNMTLTGLQGELAPRVNNELYQRPTGGSYVSLDPGWGPDDERTWITSRSCYVQNCCTFGYGCVGQKIDGSLHNGGYKSIVSNDFTQIISDGIGAWVSNNGRAELVSVFTYYSHIGMFTEAGGIIRSTNGNSSYGTYGTVADGNDPKETPRYGQINNRLTQADVVSAFAGEVNDEILILEYGNAGQQYSQVTYNITGSGTGAQVTQEEYRDNGIFEVLTRDPNGNSSGTPGGLGYILLGNNAQAGDAYTITIASNDQHAEEDILGLRLIITSGTGTGQYGYVKSYNTVTKVIEVYRESDDQPGWDHVIPGHPIAPLLVTSTTYKFEPRPIFDPPPYSATNVNLVAGQQYSAAVYGETTETFTVTGLTRNGPETIVEATWLITKNGRSYRVDMEDSGSGYTAGQLIVIAGGDVGGVTGENDIIISVETVSEDSTDSILTYKHQGIGASGKFVAVPSQGNTAIYSLDGETWNTTLMPTLGDWKCLASGNNRFVALRPNSNRGAVSYDGITWSDVILPANRAWSSVCYGNGVFLAVAENLDAGLYSTDGFTWTSISLPSFGDSTYSQWIDVAYGQGRFVALSNSGNYIAQGTYNNGDWTWSIHIMDVINDSTSRSWVSIAYGNGRWVAIANTGEVSYSFDNQEWYLASMPTQDGSTLMNWRQIRYGQGVFFALCDTGGNIIAGDITTGPTTFAAQSYDGIVWQGRELSTASVWGAAAFGNPDISLGDSTTSTNSTPMWVIIPADESNIGCKVLTGARALGRAWVEGNTIAQIRLWEPGSGYSSSPTLTLIDPRNTLDAQTDCRIADGVLAQPTWVNRGNRYRTSTTVVEILGNGFADRVPDSKFIAVSGLQSLPGPGTQFRFRGQPKLYTVVRITYESTQIDGTVTANFQISPPLKLDDNLEHDSEVEIRTRYSQVRITGHDFLDVGTGNFVDSNYPELYTLNDYYYAPENEVEEFNGGRVFYTSTDQSGNFRSGELFAVEQATGIVTVSADFFNLKGLSELRLGGVRLGGTGTVVREFSTDPTFTSNSNNVVPTQRAIKAYLQSRLNIGGSDLSTASFIAGTVLVGPNLIRNTANLGIIFPAGKILKFEGQGAELSGSIVAQNMFMRSFTDRTS